jgi:hypothetical protein
MMHGAAIELLIHMRLGEQTPSLQSLDNRYRQTNQGAASHSRAPARFRASKTRSLLAVLRVGLLKLDHGAPSH